jgi:hypothetical protein
MTLLLRFALPGLSAEEIEQHGHGLFKDRHVEHVDDLLSAALAADEVGRLQGVEVVREGALGEVECLRELARAPRAPLEDLQDLAPAGIGDGLEDVLGTGVGTSTKSSLNSFSDMI